MRQMFSAPLPDTDYAVMNCPRNEIDDCCRSLPQATQHYIANVTHRLFEVDWLTRMLEDQVSRHHGPALQEGLLSLQVYLLLTCADTLGHLHFTGRSGVGDRFRAFFNNLSREARQNLLLNIYVWRTDSTELTNLGLGDAGTVLLSRRQVLQFIQPLADDVRWEALVDFLYLRRNYHTHECWYPQLGAHPNLQVMLNQRLNVPGTAGLGELDHFQRFIVNTDNIYFAYYETDDLIATIRWSIVRGLGQVIGRI
jgi:hypothetical protein